MTNATGTADRRSGMPTTATWLMLVGQREALDLGRVDVLA
jgi:hypothetical protein